MNEFQITTQTTIYELLSENIISVRTYSALQLLNAKTAFEIKSLVDNGTKFSNLRGCGKKAQAEVDFIIDSLAGLDVLEQKYDMNFKKVIISEFESTLEDNEEDLTDPIKKLFSSAESFYEYLKSDFTVLMEVKTQLTREQNVFYRDFLKAFIRRILDNPDYKTFSNKPLYRHISFVLGCMPENPAKFSSKEIYYNFFSDIKKKALHEEYNRAYKNSNVRARHYIEDNNLCCEDFVDLLDYNMESLNEKLNLRAKSSTLHYLKDVINDLRFHFKRISESTNNDVFLEGIYSQFRKLEQSDIIKIVHHLQRCYIMPCFFIMKCYFQKSEDAYDMMYNLYYGIGTEERNLDEVAETTGYTRERVRQIITDKRIPACDYIDRSHLEYDGLFEPYFLNEDTPIYNEINNSEKAGLSFKAFAAILRVLDSSFIVKRVFGKTIAVKKSLWDKLDVRCLRKEIEYQTNKQHKEDHYINGAMLIGANKLSDEERTAASQIVAYIAGIRGLECEKGMILVPQNAINVPAVLYDILKRHNREMSQEEIFIEFKKIYPDHKYTEPRQLGSYLTNHDHIRPLGKRGVYILDSFEGVFFEKIMDAIIHILQRNSTPVHSAAISNEAVKSFPSAEERVVREYLVNDDRIIRFENDYYGLKSKNYDPRYKPVELKLDKRFKSKTNTIKQSAKNIEDLLDFDF